jgi:hypothetical protein
VNASSVVDGLDRIAVQQKEIGHVSDPDSSNLSSETDRGCGIRGRRPKGRARRESGGNEALQLPMQRARVGRRIRPRHDPCTRGMQDPRVAPRPLRTPLRRRDLCGCPVLLTAPARRVGMEVDDRRGDDAGGPIQRGDVVVDAELPLAALPVGVLEPIDPGEDHGQRVRAVPAHGQPVGVGASLQ